MILNRLGNKTRIAKDIICHFPQHRTFIDMFFGAGGIYFNKPLAQYNFCNDIDDDVFNLYTVLQKDKEAFIKAIILMPISQSLFNYWKTNKETEPIKKAIRFLFLSNFNYMGKPNTFRLSDTNPKRNILDRIDFTFNKMSNTSFVCVDFKKLLPLIGWSPSAKSEHRNAFIYADPPYLDTDNSSYQQGFKEQDTIDLFEVLIKSKMRFALSEFDNPFIIDLAKHHNLEVITIGERQNMKNRRTEILVVNYESPALYSLFRNQEHSLSLV